MFENKTTPAAEQKQEEKAKVYRYRAKEKCTYGGKFRKVGEIIVLSEKKEVPHFELVKTNEE